MIWKFVDVDHIYLTFDDGPIPEATPYVLDTLAEYGAKATFFCVGDNVKKYPEIYQRIINDGHSIGNHTFNHLNGWKTDNDIYLENVDKAAEVIDSNLFRPPYGRIKPGQLEAIHEKYNVVLWDVLSGDFDPKVTSDQLYANVINNAQDGSIIVLHDNVKSIDNLKAVLPKILDFYKNKGINMKEIPMKGQLNNRRNYTKYGI